MKKNNPRLIFLVGFMGSGKTTIGKIMAKQLGFQFLDTDAYISQKEGKSIATIFSEIGEKGFRKMEMNTLKDFQSLTQNYVIATGGGMPCNQYRLNRMKKMGEVVYLKIDVKSAVIRLTQGGNKRPLLAGLSPVEMETKISQLLKKRDQYYDQATTTINSLEAKRIDFRELLS